MIPNEMKSWREVMDDVARLTKERDEARGEAALCHERQRNDWAESARQWKIADPFLNAETNGKTWGEIIKLYGEKLKDAEQCASYESTVAETAVQEIKALKAEVERLRNLYEDAKQSANAWRSVRGISEREHELERQLAEAHAEISRMREVESAELRAARDEAIRLGQEAEALRETLRTVSDVPSGWQADDEVTYAIDQLCEAAYAFASDKDHETPLEDHKTAKAERVAVAVLKATIGKRIEAATAGLRERAEEAERERDEVTQQLNNERADHVRIAVAVGSFYESDYSGPVRAPVDVVIKEIEALVKDRAAADILKSTKAELACLRTSMTCKGCGGTVGDHLAPDQGGCPGHFEIDGVEMIPSGHRDKLRAENASLRQALTGRTAACGACEQTTREIARLRAVAKKIAQALAVNELTWERGEDWFDHRLEMLATFGLAEELRAALRAETPAAPQPAPNGGVERAIAELAWVASMMHGGAFDPAWTKARVDIDARIAALRAEAQAAPSITPSPMDTASNVLPKRVPLIRFGDKPVPAEPAAPQGPSVEKLRTKLHLFLNTRCPSADFMGEFVSRLEALLVGIVEEIARRGGAS